MKPLVHAKLSVIKFGGTLDDYIDVHEFLDSSKAHVPDMRHRAILHSSFGIYIAQELFGVYRVNSDGNEYSIRDICENHVIEDLGFIPTVNNWFEELVPQPWMSGLPKGFKKIEMVD
jgi:hypothetical protein